MDRQLLEFLFAGPLFSIFRKLNGIERIERKMSAIQDAIDGISQSLSSVNTQLQEGFGEVTSEIHKLKDQVSNGVTPDLSGLQSQVEQLQRTAQQLDDVVPDSVPEPEPEPEPEPTPEPEIPSDTSDSGDVLPEGGNV